MTGLEISVIILVYVGLMVLVSVCVIVTDAYTHFSSSLFTRIFLVCLILIWPISCIVALIVVLVYIIVGTGASIISWITCGNKE